jgi:hypothetical protein
MEYTKTRISKQEAAVRQLTAAIRLFFQQGDTFAVHTLAAAALQILLDLGKREGFVSPIRDPIRIRPERAKEWFRALARTENFLKHADRDPDDILEHDEELTAFHLFEAVAIAESLLKWDAPERLAFESWFMNAHPNVFKPEYAAPVQALAKDVGADLSNKALWYEWILLRSA